MKKYYYDKKKCLIVVEKEPDSNFWDDQWNINASIRNQIMGSKFSFVSLIVKLYFKPQYGILLEGGCGNGNEVARLTNNNYKCIGIDYAKKTIEILNKIVPELDIRYGNLEKIPFADNYFSGFLSLGVIEHYWQGFDKLAQEMDRVLRKNGLLFMTFPYMSPLRKIKVWLQKYPKWPYSEPPKNFFEYILDPNEIISYFKRNNYRFIQKFPFDGLKGMKDEIPWLTSVFSNIYNREYKSKLDRAMRLFLRFIFAPFGGHIILLIFQKK